ncbi:MAG TPA: sigma factor, partial [Gemmataceae bacterium]|nr:sigma factor [Gemmataceae bacterium]
MSVRRLAALIDSHGAALVLFARQWCSAPEDAVQDALCKLAEQSRWPEDAVAWLYRVVRNRAIDAGRSERRRQRREAAASRPEGWFAETAIDGLDADAAVAALESLP